MSTALFSVYKKTPEFAAFAAGLHRKGWHLFGSAGTVTFLRQHDIGARDVAELVGPPILGHRVVTLSREIAAAVLARLDNPADLAELKRIGVDPFSLVYVDLYPLAEAMENPDRTIESVREKIDIGGPTLLRAAAKGDRLVISNEQQFKRVERFLSDLDIATFDQRQFRAQLAVSAETVAEEYCHLARRFYSSVANGTFPAIP